MIDDTLEQSPEANSPVASTATNAAESLNQWVVANPIAATLASAAAGAGMVALLALLARDDRPTQRAAGAVRDARDAAQEAARGTAQDLLHSRDFSELRSQLSDLSKRVLAALPSKAAASDAVDAATEKTDAMWSSVKQEAEDLLGQLRPHAAMATDIAKSHPGWTALVIGAIGALLGSQLMSASDSRDSATT